MIVLLAAAWGADHHVLRAGETLDSIAGDPTLAEAIRALNGLQPGAVLPIGTVLLVPGPAGAHDESALVLSVSGSLRIAGTSVDLGPGATVAVGATVCTGASGYATLRLATSDDRSHDDVSMLSSTCLSVDAAVRRRSGRASLLTVSQGGVSVRAETDPGAVTVRTPSGVTTGDRGGFRVTIEPGASRTEAIDAPAAVLSGGVEVRLAKNQGSRLRVDQAPTPPVDLLPPGTPIRPEISARMSVADFEWAPVDRALGYRIEIATSADFADMVQVEEIPHPRWTPDVLALPFRVPGVWWRIASFDRTGFLGAPSPGRPIGFPLGVGP